MEHEPILDAHLHLWDTRIMNYPWLAEVDTQHLNRPYLLDQYHAATAARPPTSMVFVQCEVHPSLYEVEADWVAEQAKADPRIKGLVAWAPLHKGVAVRDD